MADAWDERVRAAAFAFLERATVRHGETGLPWDVLRRGFQLDGESIAMVSMQGIFKPRQLHLPLTIRTTAPRPDRPAPYEDQWDAEGLRYAYRLGDHTDNRLLRDAMREGVPLVYLFGIEPGVYLPSWPVYIVDDDPAGRRFTVSEHPAGLGVVAGDDVRRYAFREVRTRLHQARFRARVVRAYHSRCAMCQLRHRELLDAAHIVADIDEAGVAQTANGMSLCKLHHAAFDRHILGVRPDLVVEVRGDVLAEIDGPMLRHGLQALEGKGLLVLPRAVADRPGRQFLEQRYEQFRSAS